VFHKASPPPPPRSARIVCAKAFQASFLVSALRCLHSYFFHPYTFEVSLSPIESVSAVVPVESASPSLSFALSLSLFVNIHCRVFGVVGLCDGSTEARSRRTHAVGFKARFDSLHFTVVPNETLMDMEQHLVLSFYPTAERKDPGGLSARQAPDKPGSRPRHAPHTILNARTAAVGAHKLTLIPQRAAVRPQAMLTGSAQCPANMRQRPNTEPVLKSERGS
jgi:hypothetical protein